MHTRSADGDENVDQLNRPADVQLVSPNEIGSPHARWNVQPETADSAAQNAGSSKAAVPSEFAIISVASAAPPARRSTRAQPARKRKG